MPFGSSLTADGNTVTVVTHHVGDLFSAVVHTEPATEAPPACIEESFQVPASDESIQMDNSQCEDVTETVHHDGAVFLHQMETDQGCRKAGQGPACEGHARASARGLKGRIQFCLKYLI